MAKEEGVSNLSLDGVLNEWPFQVAQGCRLGNQAEFVPRPNMNTNQQKTP